MLLNLGPRVKVIPGGVNIGLLIAGDGRLILIDTGLTESNAKKTLRTAREETGGEVVAILTTHAHADHFGGNASVVKRTGAAVYAPARDEAILRDPLLQPTLLFGGADPLDTLRVGFLLASASPVDQIVRGGPLVVADIEIEVIPLYGHSPGQVGYLIDGVFFCADVVLPDAILEKYKIPYLFSLTDHLAALDHALTIPCQAVVPGHGPILASIAPSVGTNRRLIDDVTAALLDIVVRPATADDVLAGLLDRFGADPADAPAYYLLQPTAAAFLAHLHRMGQVSHRIANRRSFWEASPAKE